MNHKNYIVASNNANSIIDFEFEARKLEEWLLNNTGHKNFDKELSRYNGILFNMASRKEFNENLAKGVEIPKSFGMPRRIYKNEDVMR
jgi:hypothetical protein